MNHNHDAYARSLVLCYSHEIAAALGWADYLAKEVIDSSYSGSFYSYILNCIYGRWVICVGQDMYAPTHVEPNWSHIQNGVGFLHSHVLKVLQLSDLSWDYQGQIIDERAVGMRLQGGAYFTRSPKQPLLKACDTHWKPVTLEDFPPVIAVTMAFAIIRHRCNTPSHRLWFRSQYLKSKEKPV